MVCIHCGHQTQVVNSRRQKRSNQVWRRRQCGQCGALFTTQETPTYAAIWTVRGKTGRLKPFSRDKLFLSLYKSCQHRPTAISDAKGLADTIMSKLPAHLVDGAVASSDVARVAEVALSRFDTAASVHYQAFHA
jgi:transcriptional repressor NrdR